MPGDEELMIAVAQGDLAAFNEIVLRYQDSAWKVAYHFIGNAAEAEDIAQEAFLKIFDAASRYKPTASFSTYLFRILNRLCIDYIRKKRPVPTDKILDDTDPRPSSEERVIQNERDTTIQEAVDALPSNQRMAVILRYFEGLKHKKISETLGVSIKAVERLLAHARETLESRLTHLFRE